MEIVEAINFRLEGDVMNLNIKNFGIIKEANISLNGLTVIAGENDSGKSTVGKLLFSIIKAIKRPDELELGLLAKLKKVNNFCLELHRFLRNQKAVPLKISDEIKNILEMLSNEFTNSKQLSLFKIIDSDYLFSLCNDIGFLMNEIAHYIQESSFLKMMKRWDVISFEIVYSEDNDLDALNQVFFSEFQMDINNAYTSEEGYISFFENDENNNYKINFINNKIEINSRNFYLPFADSILLESPIVINLYSSIKNSTTSFNKVDSGSILMRMKPVVPFHIMDLISKLESSSRIPQINRLIMIDELVSGEIEFSRNSRDFEFSKKVKNERYVHKILNTASGIKSFGILQTLLSSNYLNDMTLIILDEPEVHLHPKWQLKYAEVIVKLVEIGVPILITSHSPYFIQALKVYSDQHNLTGRTNFYLSEKHDDGVVISDVTSNLNKIFSMLAEPFKELVWR